VIRIARSTTEPGRGTAARSRDSLLRQNTIRRYAVRQVSTAVPVEGAWPVARCQRAQAARSMGAGSRTDRRATAAPWRGSRRRRSTRSGRRAR
jgi:hypothetical protein